MTEDDAKTRWCFAARVGSGVNGLGAMNRDALAPENNPELVHENTRCIASTCMAWRWSEPKRTVAFLEAVQKHMQGQSKPNFNTATQAVFAETGGQFARIEGGCGLAGDVQ